MAETVGGEAIEGHRRPASVADESGEDSTEQRTELEPVPGRSRADDDVPDAVEDEIFVRRVVIRADID